MAIFQNQERLPWSGEGVLDIVNLIIVSGKNDPQGPNLSVRLTQGA
jgi:hypothetical protein